MRSVTKIYLLRLAILHGVNLKLKLLLVRVFHIHRLLFDHFNGQTHKLKTFSKKYVAADKKKESHAYRCLFKLLEASDSFYLQTERKV